MGKTDKKREELFDSSTMKRIEKRLKKLIKHANEGMKVYEPFHGNPDSNLDAFKANTTRRLALEDALKVVRGEKDSIGDLVQ